MSGRPVRRRVLTDVLRAGGWQAVLGRIASGDSVAGIARTFGVSPGFFSTLIREDPRRHGLVAEARRRSSGRERLAEIGELLGGLARQAASVAAGPVEAEAERDREIR